MLEVRDVCFSYESTNTLVLDSLSLTVDAGSRLALLGPSGCGKTTTLLLLAGLLKADSGVIEFDGRFFYSSRERINLSPAQRAIGFMFQSYAIWPHMTALENVSFPLKLLKRKTSGAMLKKESMALLERFGLAGVAHHPGTKLSGGQQQRLALARALASNPRLLLLDEPLSNVEPSLRSEVAEQIRSIQIQTGITMIFVTHDHQDAMALSSEIAIMRDGEIVQHDVPSEIYDSPADAFVANFVGRSNFLEVVPMESSETCPEGFRNYQTPLGDMILKDCGAGVGSKVSMSIKHTAVRIHASGPGSDALNVYPATVERTVYYGHSMEYYVCCADVTLVVRGARDTTIRKGDHVYLEFDPLRSEIFTDQHFKGTA
ncbi:MAG: ABC transporter ATP-binding protein [Pseudohongiellaceae bacterium]